jgi:serine/threonine protein kinase
MSISDPRIRVKSTGSSGRQRAKEGTRQPEGLAAPEPPNIPDYQLVRLIGKGGYGEVWLARGVTGNFRAVKVIHRSQFKHARPFEREFLGIQHFEPVSRMHPGLVAILHVGKNESAGTFHYVMEVADDMAHGQQIDADTYVPRTLSGLLHDQHRLPIPEAAHLSLALTSALEFLHLRGLVHRDIKPSNIIFVNGAPKFADVGLVTGIGEGSSYVGTAGYIPPEGPGSPQADVFSLGKVLYQVVMGMGESHFPELPSSVADGNNVPDLLRFNEIILKACAPDFRLRYQSAAEMEHALVALAEKLPSARGRAATRELPASTSRDAYSAPPPMPEQKKGRSIGLRVALLYKAHVPDDWRLLQLLQRELTQAGCEVFYDRHLVVGVEWAREIAAKIRNADAAIVLLSSSSIRSEMIAYEVEIASQSSQQQHGRPRVLPVRVQFAGALPPSLASHLDSLQYVLWEGPQDDQRLVQELLRSLETSPVSPSAARLKLESIGGAVPLDSQFYVLRSTDQEFQNALSRQDSIVLVKGARQMGKTSLLARGLQQARESGAKVALADFQKFNLKHLASVEAFYLTLGGFVADQLELSVLPEDVWDKRRSPNTNFERYLRREVLGKLTGHFVWGLDEVDRLFTCDFGSEVFGLFRSWHNERALDPQGPWSRLTLCIAYATEAHLFITDVNQSPFNVGTRLTLDDFTLQQVMDLNTRYGSPLRDSGEINQFFGLLGGQPYLTRRGFNELAAGTLSFANFKAHADKDEGVFGDHLRRILVLLAKDHELADVVRGVLHGQPCPNSMAFYRLRSAGLMRGDSPQEVHLRCEIYGTYLRRHLT